MTKQEAINNIKNALPNVHAFKEELEVLENKPKKIAHDCLPHPTMDSGQLFDCWWCPNCEEILNEKDRYDYCPYCGQALDWSK